MNDWSEPEPDLAVVPGGPRDYLAAHPNHALLIVEVRHSSLQYDREPKLPLYAAARFPEAWLLRFDERCLEVYRDPGQEGYETQLQVGESPNPSEKVLPS